MGCRDHAPTITEPDSRSWDVLHSSLIELVLLDSVFESSCTSTTIPLSLPASFSSLESPARTESEVRARLSRIVIKAWEMPWRTINRNIMLGARGGAYEKYWNDARHDKAYIKVCLRNIMSHTDAEDDMNNQARKGWNSQWCDLVAPDRRSRIVKGQSKWPGQTR